MNILNDIKDYLSKTKYPFERKGNTSWRFVHQDREDTFETIARTFDLSNDTRFRKAFDEAVGGSGNESNKIDSIYSSSLLSLLFFYTSTQNGGLMIPGINGTKFTKCYFEFQNPVFKEKPHGPKPSNIDCVLTDENQGTILFLECKFIEYIRDACSRVSPNQRLKQRYETDDYTKNICHVFHDIEKKGGRHYYGGIKQIITHYSGLQNFLNGVFQHPKAFEQTDGERAILAKHNTANVFFAEVIYDCSCVNKQYEGFMKTYLDDQTLIFQKIEEEGIVSVLPLLTYQSIVSHGTNRNSVLPSVLEYYKL